MVKNMNPFVNKAHIFNNFIGILDAHFHLLEHIQKLFMYLFIYIDRVTDLQLLPLEGFYVHTVKKKMVKYRAIRKSIKS